MKKIVSKTTAARNPVKNTIHDISPENQKRLAGLIAMTNAGFVNKWLGDLLWDITECRNLVDHLEHYDARSAAAAKQITVRMNKALVKCGRADTRMVVKGTRLICRLGLGPL